MTLSQLSVQKGKGETSLPIRQEPSPLSFRSLPYPPSANRLWRAVKGRNIKSEEYRRWLSLAVPTAALWRLGCVSGAYDLYILADRPDRRRRDLGNLEKPISDALVAAGNITDDCNAKTITLAWSDTAPNPAALVHIAIVVRG